MFHKHTISFKHAYDGMIWAFKTQPNYIIHLSLGIVALVGGIILEISYPEFLVILILIMIGLVIETINTAIEQTTDAIDTKIRPDIKVAKDVAAGAMLIFAIGAFMMSCVIFIPRILNLIFH